MTIADCQRPLCLFSRHRRATIAASVVVAAVVVVVYATVSPEQSRWFPRCMFLELTGLQCPGCGSQRALHALLNGDVPAAMAFNPFLVVSIPYLLAVALTTFSSAAVAVKARRYVQHRLAVTLYIVLLAAWWIGRNLL